MDEKQVKCKDCDGFIEWELDTTKAEYPIAIGKTVVIVEFVGKCNKCGCCWSGISSGQIEVTGRHTTGFKNPKWLKRSSLELRPTK